MSEFKKDPLITLETKEDLLNALNENLGAAWESMDKWAVKSVWLCDLIEEIAQTRFPYNTDVMREAERRLGIAQQPDNSSTLSILVYDAQGYRRSDNLKRDGFVPLTQEVVDQAFEMHAKIEIHGYNILLQAVPMLYNVREIGGKRWVMPPHSRNKAVRIEGQPARIVKK